MLPLFTTNPAAAGAFLTACLIWLIPETVGMFRQMAKTTRKAVAIQDRGSLSILIGLQWAGIALNFLLAWIFPGAVLAWQRPAFFLSGILSMLLGVTLRWYAIWTLGQFFTRDVAVSADQAVVRHGPYRWIRHPAYSGTFLTMFGLGLAMTNWASLIALLTCVFLGHFYRVTIEEAALIRTIGQPYVEYMHQTKRFLPFLF